MLHMNLHIIYLISLLMANQGIFNQILQLQPFTSSKHTKKTPFITGVLAL